jgi:negative regulator of flagellin synthesis FlgM
VISGNIYLPCFLEIIMSIDRTQASNPIGQIQQRDVTDTSSSTVRSKSDASTTPVAGTSVTLSNTQAVLNQSSSQDINTARVQQIKQAIREGKLTADTGKIADALIQSSQDDLNGA